MWDLLSFLIWTMVLVGVLFAIGFGAKLYLSGALPFGPLLGGGRDRRLDVIEQSNVDGRRKLLLVRRDDVEHLIMTGGPVDVVIETGIGAHMPAATLARATVATERSTPDPVAEPVFSRPARTFGKAVGEN
ncbi:MAG: flagellar biosynthetic protein FliO [Alphaproteobacteria bacterium]|nr:flagellar biosynthetic protein FliO [Alphaproteobacteria bacterium]